MASNELLNIMQVEVSALRLLCEDLRSRTEKLEYAVILGHDGTLPLAEVVRNLTNTVSDYIARKDREEIEQKEKKEIFDKERRDQGNRWKILIASIGIPMFLALLGQVIIFYFQIYPLIETLSAN